MAPVDQQMPNKQAHLSVTNENTDTNYWAKKSPIYLFVLLDKQLSKSLPVSFNHPIFPFFFSLITVITGHKRLLTKQLVIII